MAALLPKASLTAFSALHWLLPSNPFSTENLQFKAEDAVRPKRAIASPRETLLPHSTQAQKELMAYPTNLMPGARDVATPQGFMRVNEWGPPHGQKIVFVHGGSTPSPIWYDIADGLATQGGYRVITLDLWGRGYSDLPCSRSSQQCQQLAKQIAYALQSSTTAGEAADQGHGVTDLDGKHEPVILAGYSLGGTIVTDFAGRYPHMVSSLLLFAPGGLLRRRPAGHDSSWFRCPKWLVKSSVRRHVIGNTLGLKVRCKRRESSGEGLSTSEKDDALTTLNAPGLLPPDITALTQWQFDNHAGFVDAYWDMVLHGPIHGQDPIYKRLGQVIMAGNGVGACKSFTTRRPILCFLGDEDDILPADELEADMTQLLPAGSIDFVHLAGGHDFVRNHSSVIIDRIMAFLG